MSFEWLFMVIIENAAAAVAPARRSLANTLCIRFWGEKTIVSTLLSGGTP
jgi:hypothetical protein